MSNETLFGLRGRPWKASYTSPDDPLNSFNIPALERSVAYARIAGFFTSASLSIAAKGIASLVSRGGRMRLLVGAQLEQLDVDAIRRGIELQDTLAQKLCGILTDPEALADHLVKRRIETLAWLVANDRLEIKVCVEADPQTGAPIVSNGYFHAKSGILRDELSRAAGHWATWEWTKSCHLGSWRPLQMSGLSELEGSRSGGQTPNSQARTTRFGSH